MTDGTTFAVKAQQCMMNSLLLAICQSCKPLQSISICQYMGKYITKKSNSICHYVEKYVNTHIPLNLCMIYGEVYEKKPSIWGNKEDSFLF